MTTVTFVDKGFEKSPADDFEYALVLRVGHYFETLADESRPRRVCGCVDVDLDVVGHDVEGIVLKAYEDTHKLDDTEEDSGTKIGFEEQIGGAASRYFQRCLGVTSTRRECGCVEVDVNTAERFIRGMALQAYHETHGNQEEHALPQAS